MANELTEIRILKNVPLDTTYRNTVNFASATAQSSYFLGKSKYTMGAQMYQRVQRGFTRIAKNADDLYDCNYLMFQNTHFGNKWFYCFITGVEYVNNAVSDVYFEVDVMQTWLFDWDFKKTYVSRATPNSDGYGANILPEPLNFPETAYSNIQLALDGMVTAPEDLAYVFGTTEALIQDDPATPAIIGGCPTACNLYGYNNYSEFATAVAAATHQKDGNVQFAFAIPQTVHNAINGGNNGQYPSHASKITRKITIPASTLHSNYSGTTWNKCLVYPYQSLVVLTPNGYQEFDPSGFSGDATFTITYTISPTPSYVVTTNYQDKTVLLDGGTYPSIPFSNSQYPQYAQAKLGIAQALQSQALSNAMGALVPTVTGLANGGSLSSIATGAVQGLVQTAGNVMQGDLNVQQMEERLQEQQVRTAPSMHGSSSDFGEVLVGRSQPTFYMKYLRKEYAESLDSFFTVKGYAKNQLVTPRKTSMKSYKYLQTVNCDITGSIPANDMALICRIHDNGITYWSSPDSIGVY